MNWLRRLVRNIMSIRLFCKRNTHARSVPIEPEYFRPEAESVTDPIEIADVREAILDQRIREWRLRDRTLDRRLYGRER